MTEARQPSRHLLPLLRWTWRYPCLVCEEPRWATSRLGLYERVRPGCPLWFHRRDRARWTVGGRRFPMAQTQPPHEMDDCEVRCLSCTVPMDDCPTDGPWCCDNCCHGVPTPPCHDLRPQSGPNEEVTDA